MIRVLIAEDQAMVRGALASLLQLEGDLDVVAQVARGDEVLTATRDAAPDVALLDIEMPGGDGLTAAGELADALPDVRVVILTTFGRPGHQLGNFTHGHTLAVDSKGDVYVAETDTGRRIQKFRTVK